MAKFISVAQLKGGAGKSTVVTNLVAALSQEFHTGLIDADMPQGTSARWAAIRQTQQKNTPAFEVLTASSVNELALAAERLESECDVVVIDLPPRSLKYLREVLPYSDLVVMPLTASAADVWATEQLMEAIREGKRTSKRLKARLVWNRLRTSKATEQFLADTAGLLRAKELESRLGQRTAYVESLGRGLSVLEWSDAKASAEFAIFYQELKQQLKLD